MSQTFNIELLKALGLEGRPIQELTIKCSPLGFTELHIMELVDPQASLETVSRTFDLVERQSESE